MIYTHIYYCLGLGLLALVVRARIITPQQNLLRQTHALSAQLVLGASVTTHDNKTGTILFIGHQTVRLQDESGNIIEVMRQSIRSIQPAQLP